MTTPTQKHQFLMKLNEEAVIKVSFKKLHPFQNWHFSTNATFSKWPKIKDICTAGYNLEALFNDMLVVLKFLVVFGKFKEMS